MNAELKQEWTAALRSGDYQQGTGALCGPNGYCCLGVLGDVLVKRPGSAMAWDNSGRTVRLVNANGATSNNYLSESTGHLAGLSRQMQRRLAKMNDQQGKSFAEIANYIDANL